MEAIFCQIPMKASDLFIKCLEAEGVEYVFGIPGEENLDFLDSLKRSNIKLVLTRHEQTAVFMAATYGRFTGKPGVALATLGPGATNMVTGVAHATLAGTPVLVITGQKPIRRSKQGYFQIIDVVDMMRPITKSAATVPDASRIPALIRNAFKIAEEERPGAVHLELPEDIAREETPEVSVLLPQKIRRPAIDEKMLAELVKRLERAKRPMILVGAGANRKRITKYLTKFIETYDVPFFTSQMGKGVVDERLSQCIGTAALTAHDDLHDAIAKADLILAVGYDVIEKPASILASGAVETVHINFSPAKVDDVYFPALEAVGDIGNTFWQLCEAGIDASGWDFSEIYAIRDRNIAKRAETARKEDGAAVMGPRRFVRELRAAMGEEDILALDNGWYKIWIARNYPAYRPNTVLLDNALATMGAGLPAAMMAKMLHPERRVACVTGDGGLLMNL
jgi:acetolactate synthase I/II/III large subunit